MGAPKSILTTKLNGYVAPFIDHYLNPEPPLVNDALKSRYTFLITLANPSTNLHGLKNTAEFKNTVEKEEEDLQEDFDILYSALTVPEIQRQILSGTYLDNKTDAKFCATLIRLVIINKLLLDARAKKDDILDRTQLTQIQKLSKSLQNVSNTPYRKIMLGIAESLYYLLIIFGAVAYPIYYLVRLMLLKIQIQQSYSEIQKQQEALSLKTRETLQELQ